MGKKLVLLKNNKGTLLMHTVVLSVIMAMMGTMMLKWATNRYETVAKSRRQIKASAMAQSCLAKKMLGWADNPPLDAASADLDCQVEIEDGTVVDMKLGTEALPGPAGSFAIIVSITQDIL